MLQVISTNINDLSFTHNHNTVVIEGVNPYQKRTGLITNSVISLIEDQDWEMITKHYAHTHYIKSGILSVGKQATDENRIKEVKEQKTGLEPMDEKSLKLKHNKK